MRVVDDPFHVSSRLAGTFHKKEKIMFKNYLKISIRNIKNQKSYSFINIFGLTIGLTCSILILFYIQYEFSFDKYHQNAEDIYRVVMKQPGNVYQGIECEVC